MVSKASLIAGAMGQSHIGLVAFLGLTFIIFTICLPAHAAQKTILTSASSTPSLPPTLRDRLSPLTKEQEVYYGKIMKRGGGKAMSESVLCEFCKSARLLCGAALHESAWGTAIEAKTVSLAGAGHMPFFEGSLIDKSFFKGWKRRGRQNSLPSSSGSSKMGKTGTEPESLHEHSPMGTYFREKDLMSGAELVLPRFLYELRNDKGDVDELNPSFLPASLALFLPPFVTHHLKDILKFFHIPFLTHMAREVEKALNACTGPGHEKNDDFIISFCATSFEAMLKFASSMLTAPTNKIQALTNSKVVGSHGNHVTIVWTAQLAVGHGAVDCHGVISPFKVMGCHRIKDSKSLLVRVANEEGFTMDLLVACHKNTTLFDPHHEAFYQLHSSPGHTEICHFLTNQDIMWIPL